MLIREAILHEVNNGNIEIKPFNEDKVNPNSVDVTLGLTVHKVLTDVWGKLDLKKEYGTKVVELPTTLLPGQLYLAATQEWMTSSKYIMCYEGRSTMARYGLTSHQSAGFGDLGFAGHWTLELSVVKPLVIYPNMRIGQVMFYKPEALGLDVSMYRGNYNNEYQRFPEPKTGKPGNL